MFERYMISQDEIRNVTVNGETVGFEFKLRIPYYRGLTLSMVHDLELKVNGTEYAKDDMRFTVATGSFTLHEMETAVNNRWEFGEEATLTVTKPGGLTPGEHEVEVCVHLRISYLPFIPARKAVKKLRLA